MFFTVAPHSGSYPSALEEKAEDALFLTFRDDILGRNRNSTLIRNYFWISVD